MEVIIPPAGKAHPERHEAREPLRSCYQHSEESEFGVSIPVMCFFYEGEGGGLRHVLFV